MMCDARNTRNGVTDATPRWAPSSTEPSMYARAGEAVHGHDRSPTRARIDPAVTVILGAPGCGKTTRLVECVRRAAGADGSWKIGVLTFTRAAAQELRDRLGGLRQAWTRTIHATALRLLGGRRVHVMGQREWACFARDRGYELTGESAVAHEDQPWLCAAPSTEDDRVRALYQWGRNLGLDEEQSLRRTSDCQVDARRFRRFMRDLGEFKRKYRLLDFCDLLEQVLIAGLRPEVDALAVDEAQDLSPLQAKVVESWWQGCARVWVAGDDDQAIFTFHGADPRWLQSLAKRATAEVLVQCHRLPARVSALAERTITQNRDRLPKSPLPRHASGVVCLASREETLALLDTTRASAFLLARHRRLLGPWVGELLQLAVPFEVWGARTAAPEADPLVAEALTAHAIWCATGNLPTARTLRAMARVLLEHGHPLRKRILGAAHARPGNPGKNEERLLDAPDTRAWLGVLRAQGQPVDLLGLPAVRRRHAQLLVERYGILPGPRLTLMTIHAAKGREADLVVVVPDLNRLSWNAYTSSIAAEREAENRVLYVALTRARETLVVVEPRGRRFYDIPGLRAACRAELVRDPSEPRPPGSRLSTGSAVILDSGSTGPDAQP